MKTSDPKWFPRVLFEPLTRFLDYVFGLRKAYDVVEKTIFRSEVYPFVFIDQRQIAHISDYRLYTSIFDNVKIAYSTTGMRGYVLNEETFKPARCRWINQ